MSNVSKALPVPGVLDVIAVISNPCRYATRWHHYRLFEKHMLDSGVRLTTVELAQGNRQFEVTSPDNPRHIQLRTFQELWHKENLIDIGIAHLPSDWQYVAWIDADITFNNPYWAYETLHALQRWDVVQCFSHSVNMGPTYHPIYDSIHKGKDNKLKTVVSWLYAWFNLLDRTDLDTGNVYIPDGSLFSPKPKKGTDQAYVWHSGFAWAARRSAIKTMGGLIDWAILGSADRHMAEAMTYGVTYNPKLSPGYREALKLASDRIAKLNGNFGYVDGLVTHHWHGKLVNRSYLDRWKLLYQYQYDPAKDLSYDEHGLIQLTDSKPELRDSIRRYFTSRNEDSIDL